MSSPKEIRQLPQQELTQEQLESMYKVVNHDYRPTHCLHCASEDIIVRIIQIKCADYNGILHIRCRQCQHDTNLLLG